MKPTKELDECCIKAVFADKIKRVGRCDYRCEWCGKDVSLLWAFYQMSKQED